MIKEEIQAQLQIIEDLSPFISEKVSFDLRLRTRKLENDLESAKSIEDLQRKAFEAGRKFEPRGMLMPDKLVYETFGDYLKSKENE